MMRPCVRFQHGECSFTGGRCLDGQGGRKCPMWKSQAKSTAARVRWARKRRGEGTIGRSR